MEEGGEEQREDGERRRENECYIQGQGQGRRGRWPRQTKDAGDKVEQRAELKRVTGGRE